MSPSRPSLRTVIVSACFMLMAGGMLYQQSQIHTLHGSLEGTAEKVALEGLLNRMNNLNDQVDGITSKRLLSQEDFQFAQQALVTRIDAVQASAKQSAEAVQQLSAVAASNSDLLVIKADLHQVSESIATLRKAPVTSVVAAPAEKRSTSPKPAAPKPAATTPPPVPPPFQILGVESRGGESFLTVAPPGSTRLSQIYLVRPGDTVAGSSWRLSGIDGKTARFDVAGISRTINVQQ